MIWLTKLRRKSSQGLSLPPWATPSRKAELVPPKEKKGKSPSSENGRGSESHPDLTWDKASSRNSLARRNPEVRARCLERLTDDFQMGEIGAGALYLPDGGGTLPEKMSLP